MMTFIRWPWWRKRFFLEAFFMLGLSRLLQVVIPFRNLAPTVGQARMMTPTSAHQDHLEAIKAVRWAIQHASRHTTWPSACFVQAIAGAWMLRLRGVPYTLYLGVMKDETGGLLAHAWLRSGFVIVTGRQGMGGYQPVAYFAHPPSALVAYSEVDEAAFE